MSKSISVESSIVTEISNKLVEKFDALMVEGLKRKGYEFTSRHDLENFIRESVRCVDNNATKQRTYLVNDVPFFLHCYEVWDLQQEILDNGNSIMTATYGSFTYL